MSNPTCDPYYDQKTARMTEEEQKTREENLHARKRFNYRGLQRLQAAICLKAVADYKLALRGRRIDHIRPEITMRQCEMFFRSDMFKASSGIHETEKVIEAIRKIPASYDRVFERR